MGLSHNEFDYNNTRICNIHKRIKLVKSVNITRTVGGKEKEEKIKFTYEVPVSVGMKSTLSKNKQELKRKNTARERRQLAEWRKSHERIKNTAGQQQADDFSQLAQSFQQMVEDQTPTKKNMIKRMGVMAHSFLL